jgi:membrane protease YdiL (CAAX protease family)
VADRIRPVLAAWWVTRRSDQRPIWKAAAPQFSLGPPLVRFRRPGALADPRRPRFPESDHGEAEPRLAASPSLFLFGIVWMILAWGEEAGWRAFALPRMVAGRGFWRATTLLGVLWCVWHYPRCFRSVSPDERRGPPGHRALLVADRHRQLPHLLAVSPLGSVGVATVFHTSWNLVSTVYSFAAMDIAMTGLLALVTVIALGLDQARGRLTAPAPAT